MALTMTRTRTQTALAKLVEVLARVNGELAFVRELMDEAQAHREALQAREAQLERERGALCLTIRQFNPELDPEEVGASDEWWQGRRPKTRAGRARAYRGRMVQ
jgi:hypothetical protein